MNNKKITKICVKTKNKNYDVIIGKDILKNVNKYFNCNRNVIIITDKNIPNDYIEIVKNKCKNPYVYKINQGEDSKNFLNVKKILKFLLKNSFSRTDAIIAIGGGVVGDLSAFIASIYMRGIDFLNIPTSLLSQIDSSIGGKTGIDFLNVKNVVGSFYQPTAVLIDVKTLNTLPKRHISNGLVEAIKISAT